MDSARYQRVMGVFEAVCDLEPSDRGPKLRELCGSDADLALAVRALLEQDERSSVFLDAAPEGGAAQVLASDLAADHDDQEPLSLPENYRVTEVLGRGGMGCVYEAEQAEPKRRVAVKTIHPWLLRPRMLERFRFEANALAQLSHPGIPAIYEVGGSEGAVFLAMERVYGVPLLEWSQGKTLREKLEIAGQVADAVHHAHLRGLVHRDLKPANILVTDEDRAKVLDFGIALAVDPVVRSAADTERVGTLGYMSPEQLRGEAVDLRSDVYSLGVTLFVLLTGRPPVEVAGLTLVDAERQLLDSPAAAAIDSLTQVPADVRTMVSRALATDPDDRYTSLAEFTRDVSAFLSGLAVPSHPGGRVYHAWKLTRRRPLGVSLAAALLASLLVGLSATTLLRWAAEQERDRAQTARHAADLATDEARAAQQEAERARTTLSERNAALLLMQASSLLETDPTKAVAFVASIGEKARFDEAFSVLVQAESLGLASEVMRGHTGEIRGVSVNGDGVVASASYDDTVRLWDPASRTVRVMSFASDMRLAAWDPSGAVLAVGGREGALTLLEGGQARPLAGHLDSIQAIAWSPEGDRLASASSNGTVLVHAGTRLEHRLQAAGDVGDLSWSSDGSRLAYGGEDGRAHVWSDDREWVFDVLDGELGAVALSPDGRSLATGGEDRRVRVWDLATGRSRQVSMREHEIRVLRYAGSETLLIADRAGALTSIDLTTGEERSVQRHKSVLRSLVVSADGERALTGGDDATAWLWELPSMESRPLLGHTARVRGLAFTPDGRAAVTASADGAIRVWPVQTSESVLVGHTAAVRGLAYDPDGVLVSVAEDHTVRSWPSGQAPVVFRGHRDEVDDVVFVQGARVTSGRDGQLLAVTGQRQVRAQWNTALDQLASDGERVVGASRGGGLPVWDWRADALTVLDHPGRAAAVGYLGSTLVSGAEDGTVRAWLDGGPVELGRFTDSVSVILPAPDASAVAVGAEDGGLGIWGSRPLEERSRQHLPGEVTALAWRGSSLVVGAGSDVYLVEQDGSTRRLGGHASGVHVVGVLADGRVVSGGEDGLVKLWTDSGSALELSGLKGAVRALAIDEGTVAASGTDPRIVRWPVEVPTSRAALMELLDALTTVRLDARDNPSSPWTVVD